jgi:hypothetical protein
MLTTALGFLLSVKNCELRRIVMNKSEKWLHLSYWTGAIIDGLAALQLLLPNLFAALNWLPTFQPSLEYNYAAGVGASLMLGWSVLLIWANRRPYERKAVLLITVVPVIAGLVFTEIWVALSGPVVWGGLIPIWVLQAVLVTLFSFSYFQAAEIRAG